MAPSDAAARAAERQRRDGLSGRLENAVDGAERLVTRYTTALRSWPVMGLAVVATVVALIVGSATGTTAYAVIRSWASPSS